MFKHEIFNLLRTFSKVEIKKFTAFLKSPYFNKSKEILSLFEEIMKYYPAFTQKNFSKEKLFKSLFKERKYNDSTLRNLLFRLLHLTQRFLSIGYFERNSLEGSNYLLEELNDRGLKRLFLRNVKVIEKKIGTLQNVDSKLLFNKYLLLNNKFNYSKINEKVLSFKGVKYQFEDLNNSDIYLTLFYISELISDYLNLAVYSYNYNINYTSSLVHFILKNININNIGKVIGKDAECGFLLEIYLSLMNCFTNFNDSQKYTEYRDLINLYVHLLSPDERTFHYTNLINYCIIKTGKKDNYIDFSKELFELYKYVLKKEYYKDGKSEHLSTRLYRDILFLAVRQKKYLWAFEYVKEYSSKVHPASRENMLNYGYAYYHYAISDYEKSLYYINKIKIDYFIYKYDIRNLKLKIFFDLDYEEECLSLIHSYRESLRNDHLLPQIKKSRTKHFLYFSEKLIFYKAGKFKCDLGFLKEKISNSSDIVSKEWLLSKIDDLEKH